MQLKDKQKCKSLKKYLEKITNIEDGSLIDSYDDFIRLWTQEQTCNILTKVTYYSKDNFFNKIKEDFVRINTWIRYDDRNIKVCFDKVYNVDDFIDDLVAHEIDDLGDAIFETIGGQPIITDIDKYLSI